MTKVFKYAVPIKDHFEIFLPQNAQILKIDVQYDKPCLWALVNPDAPISPRKFRFAGTGHSIEEDPGKLYHHGTFQMKNGSLIFHIFEIL